VSVPSLKTLQVPSVTRISRDKGGKESRYLSGLVKFWFRHDDVVEKGQRYLHKTILLPCPSG